MPKFRKKPVVVEAVLWDQLGDDPDVTRWTDAPEARGCPQCNCHFVDHGRIATLEGEHIVCPGDWIITGVAGERYPCKPQIFSATYEPAEDAE